MNVSVASRNIAFSFYNAVDSVNGSIIYKNLIRFDCCLIWNEVGSLDDGCTSSVPRFHYALASCTSCDELIGLLQVSSVVVDVISPSLSS